MVGMLWLLFMVLLKLSATVYTSVNMQSCSSSSQRPSHFLNSAPHPLRHILNFWQIVQYLVDRRGELLKENVWSCCSMKLYHQHSCYTCSTIKMNVRAENQWYTNTHCTKYKHAIWLCCTCLWQKEQSKICGVAP